jgi:MOSC domain-containing protein YiiM
MRVLRHAGFVDDSRELCAECGFDSMRWGVNDAVTHMGALGWWWRNALEGLNHTEVARRPDPAVWSALEYGVHSSLATSVLRGSLERLLSGGAWNATDRINPPRAHASPDDQPLVIGFDQMLEDIEREGREMAAAARGAEADAWDTRAERAGRPPVRADSILLHAVHDASHHQMDVGRVLSSLGLGAIFAARDRPGRVTQINTSQGGVPKSPVDQVDIEWDGLAGDRQADEKHHGRPFQAVCLWSADALADLIAAGHHVFAGSVGENLTVEGLDWSSLRSGARLRVGSSLLELSFPAVPCGKQAQWFTDRDFSRLAYEKNPRWARWYAWVREPGSVATRDEVLIV